MRLRRTTCAQAGKRFLSPLARMRTFLLLCTVLALVAPQALAQQATIVGTVTDPTGAAVANAAITITNAETGQVSHLTTNETGQYVAPSLRIGRYNLQVQAAGFKVFEQNDLVLAVGDRARVDAKLELGSAEQRVTVEANAISLKTDSAEISDLITGKQVTQLATNGRSIYTLVNLTPGASSLQSDFQTPTPVGGDANVSFNGNRPGHNIYLLDGGENLDRGGSGTFSVMPSMDAIAEFRVLSSNYSAEYGLSSAATMSTVLKSGTNRYHATLWEFLRNDAFDAQGYFQDEKPKLRYNTYGFNVGGPADFWKKDHKTFFFYNMEWRKLNQGGQITGLKVPPLSAYPTEADGSAVIPAAITSDSGGVFVPNVPAAVLFRNCPGQVAPSPGIVPGQRFPSDTIPGCMISPNARALLAAGIFPHDTGINSSGIAEFNGGNDSPTFVREEIVRIDHQFNDKLSVFGHYVAEQISQTFGTTMWSGDNVPTIGNTFGNPSYSGVVHLIHTISPQLINEVAFNYNGNRINIIPKGLVSAPGDFTFNRIFTGENELNRIPIINLNNQLGTQYSANWTPWVNAADSYQIRDDVSWIKGAHQFKFGGSWLFYKKVQDVFATTQGNFQFDGSYTQSDYADFLLGLTQQYQEAGVKDEGHWNSVSWALYVQDNWRVNNKLTLNLGLRWDGVPHTYETNQRMSNFYPELFDPAQAAILADNSNIAPGSPGLGTSPNPILAGVPLYLNGIGIEGRNGVPKGLVNNYWAAFGPRIGFAYDPFGTGKNVFRGGFGIMYERVQGNDMYNAATNSPFSAQVTFRDVLLDDPHQGTNGVPPPQSIPITGITGLVRDYKLPTSYQYSVSYERSLGEGSVLSIAYVGNQNRHQPGWREINLVPIDRLADLTPDGVTDDGFGYNQLATYRGFNGIRLAVTEANAHYNSLQTSLRSTFKRDLQLQVGYTLSRAIDPATGNGNGYDLNNVSNPYLGWKYDVGPSFFDRTHVAFVNFVYDLPFLKNTDSQLLKSTLGGWQLSGIVSMQSGAPLNITWNDRNVTSVVPNSGNRPNLNGSVSYPQTVDHWFTGDFSAPADGTWGNMEHNKVRGPGRHNWNMAVFKSFVFSADRGSRLEFRAEAFNIWNHTQFRGDSSGAGAGGIITNAAASDFGAVKGSYDPRKIQFGLKLYF